MFSYSRRVKSPEWRWQRRRANPWHFEIFRHGPIINYTRLPAGGTYYPFCTFPASSECLIGISDAFSAFCLWVSVIFPTCSLYPQQKSAYSALHPQAWTYIYIYRSMPEGPNRVQSPGFPKIVCLYWHGFNPWCGKGKVFFFFCNSLDFIRKTTVRHLAANGLYLGDRRGLFAFQLSRPC